MRDAAVTKFSDTLRGQVIGRTHQGYGEARILSSSCKSCARRKQRILRRSVRLV